MTKPTKKFYPNGGNLMDYYNNQLQGDQSMASGILGTVGGIAGNLIAPGIGGQVGSMLGQGVSNLFAGGGNMITEIPSTAGTHESNPNNGVDIDNYDSSVEGNETIDNKNKFVFSNRLKPNGSKKSYADLTKPLNKKLAFRPGDKLTKDYVQGELDMLAEDQEAQKQYMDIMNEAEKLYGGLMEMKKGGFMGINPAHKGYCTPMTKSTCTPHRKALARTLKKHHGFHKKDFGGDLELGKDTLVGGRNMRYLNPEEFKQATLPKDSFLTPNVLLPQGQTGNIVKPLPVMNPTIPVNYNVPSYSKPYAPLPNPNTLARGGFFKRRDKINPNQAEIDKYKAEHPEELDEQGNFKVDQDASTLMKAQTRSNPTYLDSIKFNPNIEQDSEIEDLGGSSYRRPSMQLMNTIPTPISTPGNIKQAPNLLTAPTEEGLTKSGRKFNTGKVVPFTQLLGPASQMITSLANRNKDLANLNYRTPEFTPVDEFYAAKLAEQGQDRIAATTANAIRGAATDQGTYLAAMLGANSAMLGSPNQPANLTYDAMKTNVAGRNQNAQIKAGIQNQNIDEREKLLDNSRTQFTNSLYNAGATGSGIYRDIKQSEQDAINNDLFTKNYGNIFSNLELNPDGTIKVKKTARYGGKMKKC